MTDNVIPFTGITTVDIPAEEVLNNAKGWELDRCLVMGLTEDNEFVFGGNNVDVPKILYILEMAKRFALEEMI